MVSGWYIWRRRNSLFFLLLLLVACHYTVPPPIDVSGYGLHSGDIVCRLGNGFFSKYFKDFASKEQRYSHIGIVEVTQDTIFVLHTEASELTGIGVAKREPLTQFLEGITTFGFYRVDCTAIVRQRIVTKANEYYRHKIPFDMDFNATDDSELYCTELVAKAINYAFDSIVLRPELQLGNKNFYGLDAIYQNPMCKQLTMSN